MKIELPETKDQTIHRLQKRLQAIETNYHDLLDNFDKRVTLSCRAEILKVRKLETKLKNIQKIIDGKDVC